MRLKVYFMGAGDIAVPILQELYNATAIELVGVATQPNRRAGRGRKTKPTPVGELAEELQLSADKPVSVNTPEFMEHLKELKPDMVVVVSFGQILREGVLNYPPKGCINIHASVLPKYRGASPVASAIINRDKLTGVSFMKMERGLDTGPVYQTAFLGLDGTERTESLECKLGVLAAENIVSVLLKISSGKLTPEKQNDDEAVICRKIDKKDGFIDWSESAEAIEAKIRAYDPWPGVFFNVLIEDEVIPITINSSRIHNDLTGKQGENLKCSSRHGWVISCGAGGALELLTLTAPGRREMKASDFLNGLRGVVPEARLK